jgi:hypothetical protein
VPHSHSHLCSCSKAGQDIGALVRAQGLVSRSKGTELTPEQAQIVATAIQAYYSQLATLEEVYKFHREISAAELTRMQLVAEYAVTKSFDKLSKSAQDRLKPVLGDLKERAATSFAEGVEPRAEQQWLMDTYLANYQWGDAVAPEVNYTPYEFHRLCRTEAAFSRGEVQRDSLTQDGVGRL